MYNGSFQILFTYLEGAIKKHLNVFSLKCLAQWQKMKIKDKYWPFLKVGCPFYFFFQY